MKNKYFFLVLAFGLILILLPTSGGSDSDTSDASSSAADLTAPAFSLSEEEKRLEKILAEIEGVGEVRVLLSLKTSVSRELAESGEETLVLSGGSSGQDVVELWYTYPEYLGAVVVCNGAGSASVKLNVTRAVSSFTGLGSTNITVIKMSS